MHTFNIGGKEYRVEFRHVTTEGRRRQLYGKRCPIRGVATCVVLWGEHIAIDNAICARSDHYDRRKGRFEAFNKILKHCRMLAPVANQLFAELLKVDPEPRRGKVSTSPITQQERERRIAAGSEKRAARSARA